MNEQTSRFIEAARGLASLAVLFTHVQTAVLVVLVEIPAAHRGVPAYLSWFFYGFAHQAVVVFFVLSGFLVGGRVLDHAARGERFIQRYVLDRTIRIYVVLVPALLVTLVFDQLGRSYFGATGIYDLPIYSGRSDAVTFLGNLVNVQDIFVPYFGTNSALWTLSHEFWYYIAFGFLGVALNSAYSPTARRMSLAVTIGVTALMSLTFSYHLFGFLLWLFGVAAARVSRPTMGARSAAFLFLAVAVGMRLGMRHAWLEISVVGGLVDAAVALACANLLAALRFDPGPVWRPLRWRVFGALSDMSYSLYAVHIPILVLVCAASQHFFGVGWKTVPTSPWHWLLLLALMALVVLAAHLFWTLTEARTGAIRRLSHRLLHPARTPAPAGPREEIGSRTLR